MIAIQPHIYLMLTAMFGILMYMILGFLNAKKSNPELEFDYNYVYATIFMMATVALLYENAVEVLTVATVIKAFLVGFGGNGAVTKVAKISPTPGQVLGGGK